MTLKERDTVNCTANQSTWSHLTNQSMIPESGIMERRHRRHVSRLDRPYPFPRPPLGSLRSPIFFPVPRFLAFPHCGAWSQVTAAEVREGKQNDSDTLKVLYFKIKISSKYIILVLKQSILTYFTSVGSNIRQFEQNLVQLILCCPGKSYPILLPYSSPRSPEGVR